MTRFEEIKKYGYKFRIYDNEKNILYERDKVRIYSYNQGQWTIYDTDEKIVDEFWLPDFANYDIITKSIF